MIIGVGTDFWGNALFTHPENMIMLEAEFLPTTRKWMPVIGSMVGASTAWIMYTYEVKGLYEWKTKKMRKLYIFLNRKWMFDKVYTEWVTQVVLEQGYKVTYKGIDRGILEMLGPEGLSKGLWAKGYDMSRFQSGHLYNYTLMMFMGVAVPIIMLWSFGH
jgi:NADH-ubiquinone oxidoreductase chain 5